MGTPGVKSWCCWGLWGCWRLLLGLPRRWPRAGGSGKMSREWSLINPGQPTCFLMAQNGDPGALACDWSLRPTPKQGSCRSLPAVIGCPRALALKVLGPADTPRNTRHSLRDNWARPGLNVVPLCWRHEAAANVALPDPRPRVPAARHSPSCWHPRSPTNSRANGRNTDPTRTVCVLVRHEAQTTDSRRRPGREREAALLWPPLAFAMEIGSPGR